MLCGGRRSNPAVGRVSRGRGECDFVSRGRPLVADPDYGNKRRAGRMAQVRPCISCQEGCMGRVQEYSMINCAVNPQAARERDMAYEPILKSKKEMFVGGGVAGGEAARVLDLRGPQPERCAKGSSLVGKRLQGGAHQSKESNLGLPIGS